MQLKCWWRKGGYYICCQVQFISTHHAIPLVSEYLLCIDISKQII
jgi:hypothetical protein